jgi:hypothetical protein
MKPFAGGCEKERQHETFRLFSALAQALACGRQVSVAVPLLASQACHPDAVK